MARERPEDGLRVVRGGRWAARSSLGVASRQPEGGPRVARGGLRTARGRLEGGSRAAEDSPSGHAGGMALRSGAQVATTHYVTSEQSLRRPRQALPQPGALTVTEAR